ncbi:MAG: NAD(P)H-binding protein [Cyanobacteria bacterium RM1_2_2]|nr:NAD(P)H-binding protein [Cyanobacteria bacterium RM1_2_2]
MTSNPHHSDPYHSGQWNLGRFVKTLSFFGAIPFLSSVDWFQQWFGSRPDPKVARTVMTAATERETRQGTEMILVAGAAGRVGQQVVQQLERSYAVQAVIETDLSQVSAGIESVTAGIYCADTAEWAREQTLKTWLQNLNLLNLAYQPIFNFAQPPADLEEIWGALDDVVMGGVSESGIQLKDGVAEFSGIVSTANSGGFASIRTRNFEPPLDLAEFDGIALRVKGDGNRYKFMLRTETRWDGIAYCYSFDTVANQWITVPIPFSALIPVFRAKTVSDRAFDPAQVTALQVMLSKFEYDGALNPRFAAGAFQLQLSSIRAYRPGVNSKFVLVIPQAEPSEPLEQLVQQSGIPYTIVRPTQLTETPGGQPLRVEQGSLTGQVSTADVAALCIAALEHSEARNVSLAVTTETNATENQCAVGDWACLFQAANAKLA